MMTEFLTRIRFLIFRKKRNELDDELKFHMEQSTAAKVAAGMPEWEARRQAAIEFGAVEATREQTNRQRPGWWLGTVAQDVRYAMRGILAHRWFSAAIIATIAFGIGANTMIFTLVNAVLYKPVPVPGGERLVSITNRHLSHDDGGVPMSYPDFQDYKAGTNFYEAFEATSDGLNIVSENGVPPQQIRVERATAGLLPMLHANAILGRAFLPTDDGAAAAPVMVISYNVWQERYAGQPSVIGRQVRLDGQQATIIGVMPNGFRFPSSTDAWMPLVPTAELAKRDHRTLREFAMLKPGVSIKEANAQMDAVAERLAKQYPEDKDLAGSVMTFNQRFNGGNIRIVFLLMLAAVGFVLLIACADVANLMLSRSLARRREMSIRTALGATRWRIVRQLLIESVLLSVMGGAAGFGLAIAGVHWFDLQAPRATVRPYWIEFNMDYTVFGYFAAICILSGLLFGIAPALRSSKPDLNGVLKENAHTVSQRRGGWLSGGLVVFQFALTLLLLTGAGIFLRGLLLGITVNPFVPASQITVTGIQLPESHYKDEDSARRFFDQLLPLVRAIPGVKSASVASTGPGLGAARQQIELEHQPVDNPAKRRWVSFIAQTPGYFQEIHLPLMQGRDFNDTDGTQNHEAAVLTQDAANRLWPGENPMGKRFRLYDDKGKATNWIAVVGISADIVQELQDNDPPPLLFVPYRMEGWRGEALVVGADNDPLPSIRKVVQSIDPELPVNTPSRLTSAIEHQMWFLSLFGKIFLAFALIAMLMASVGLYAIIAHSTGSRTQEIGVRIAMGATMRHILLLIMKQGIWQISVGLGLGLLAAIPVVKMIASLPIKGQHSDPAVVGAVALTLALVGVIACWLPARRAAGLDPVKAIRYE